MPDPISALEHTPYDFVREVSPDAITFYVDGLSGIFLPDEFRAAHANILDVEYWRPEDRLSGKFGRFALQRVTEDGGEEPLDGILVMGTTIDLSGVDRDRNMKSLRHYTLNDKIRDILEERDLLGQRIKVNRADYGATVIRLDESGVASTISVYDSSYDFGRARAEGRQQTCEMFAQLLNGEIEVINVEPEPREHERIVS